MKWISVKDRLPKCDMDEVLICSVEDGGGSTTACYNHKKKAFWNIYGTLYSEVDGVTHWMYLPKPPSRNEFFEDLKEALEQSLEDEPEDEIAYREGMKEVAEGKIFSAENVRKELGL